MEELEVSIQEKNDIIQRLSSELEKVGREMDQMGVKLQEVQNNNLAEYSMVDQLKQLQEFRKSIQAAKKTPDGSEHQKFWSFIKFPLASISQGCSRGRGRRGGHYDLVRHLDAARH